MPAQPMFTCTTIASDDAFDRDVERAGLWLGLFYDSAASAGATARRAFVRLGELGGIRAALIDAASCPRTAQYFGLGNPPAMAVLDGRLILALGHEMTKPGLERLLVDARLQRERMIANDV